MAGKRGTPEQIVARLRQGEVLTAQGTPVAKAVRAIGGSEPSYYRRRAGRQPGANGRLTSIGASTPFRE